VFSLGVASADVPDVVFEITAEAYPYAATFSVLAEWGEYDPETQIWTWTLTDPVEFRQGNNLLGTLEEFSVMVAGDPEVHLDFAVQAGPSDTDFHIASALLSDFDPITNAEGYANASFSLTDFDGGSASLAGIGETGGGYLAQYNGWAGDPGGPLGATFAEGIFGMSAGFLETTTVDFSEPGSGYLPIADPVTDMSSLVSFTLSSQDLASGTSSYVIVPEPATVTLVALGALALLRRRR
jgi:hypothetical protein